MSGAEIATAVSSCGHAVRMVIDIQKKWVHLKIAALKARLSGSKDVLAESLKRHLGGEQHEESQEHEERSGFRQQFK